MKHPKKENQTASALVNVNTYGRQCIQCVCVCECVLKSVCLCVCVCECFDAFTLRPIHSDLSLSSM